LPILIFCKALDYVSLAFPEFSPGNVDKVLVDLRLHRNYFFVKDIFGVQVEFLFKGITRFLPHHISFVSFYQVDRRRLTIQAGLQNSPSG